MAERDDRDDEDLVPSDDPVDEEAWTEEIRRLRRARGDRLKELFATFDDEEGDGGPPA